MRTPGDFLVPSLGQLPLDLISSLVPACDAGCGWEPQSGREAEVAERHGCPRCGSSVSHVGQTL